LSIILRGFEGHIRNEVIEINTDGCSMLPNVSS
jgi:hypothetical protein